MVDHRRRLGTLTIIVFVTAYLTKPFHISEVIHEIVQAIEKKGRIDRLNRQFIG
ncbi:hypothetical protein [Candidatus Manganitrophus noduliformans]|uniref:hypothetical protein n=1 Tax=Candidatus Manganitrophus noduliformans TaxID=2606439 RepID=UPI0014398EAC|nr:hypothetical protein [Candidatus Manganitrophus noduliformans]